MASKINPVLFRLKQINTSNSFRFPSSNFRKSTRPFKTKADFIAQSIKEFRLVDFRQSSRFRPSFFFKKCQKIFDQFSYNGVAIKLKGRFPGKVMRKVSYSFISGKLQRSSIKSPIDFAFTTIPTKQGIISLKVWIS